MATIIANCLSAFGNLWDFGVGFFCNEKGKMMLLSLVSSSASLLAMILLGSWAGAASAVVTMTRLVAIYIKDKKGYRWNWMLILFLAMYLSVFADNSILIAALIFTESAISVSTKWFFKDVQKIRLAVLLVNFMAIASNLMIGNYASIPFNIFNITTISISLIKWHLKASSSNTPAELPKAAA